MSAEPQPQGEAEPAVEVTTPVASFKVRGHDPLHGATVGVLAAIATMIGIHIWDSRQATASLVEFKVEVARAMRESNAEIAKALRESGADHTKALQELVKAHRFDTCIGRIPADRLEHEYTNQNSLCNRIAR